MQFDFLEDLLIVFALGGLVVYALRPVRLPAIPEEFETTIVIEAERHAEKGLVHLDRLCRTLGRGG